MKRSLLLVLMSQFAISNVSAEVLTTLQAVRIQALQDCHSVSGGTAQITTAQVDSFVEVAYQETAGLDLVPAPYTQWDTISLVKGTYLYALNSDMIEGGMIWCIRQFKDKDDNRQIMEMPFFPLISATVPVMGDPTRYVLALHGQLVVTPVPVQPETLVICYQSIPPKLDSATGPILIDPKYRQMLVWRVDAAIKRKQGLYGEAAEFDKLWTEAKRKRTTVKTSSEETLE